MRQPCKESPSTSAHHKTLRSLQKTKQLSRASTIGASPESCFTRVMKLSRLSSLTSSATTYFLSSTAARAAARRAIGTRKGEQLT